MIGGTYDAAGNRLSDGTTTATYDALNRLVTQDGTSYQYNADGVLISDGTTTYTQDLAAPLSQILADGSATYVYGAGSERLRALDGPWYLGDALGSVRTTLDDAGAVLATASYDPWGVPQGDLLEPFGFTGELHHGDQVYLRARWYAPGSGTFPTRDPFAGFPEMPYSLHAYQYAYSAPTMWTDPSGECVLPDGTPCLRPGDGALPCGVSGQPPCGTLVGTPTPLPSDPSMSGMVLAGAGGLALRAPHPLAMAIGACLLLLGGAQALPNPGTVRLPRAYPTVAPVPVPPPPVSVPTVDTNVDTNTDVDIQERVATATPDPCDQINIPPGVTVAQVVGATPIKAGQDSVTKSIVIQYARAMCKKAQFPPILIVHGIDFDTVYNGHHRFVASRLARIPIAMVTQLDLRPKGFNWPNSHEWSVVRWM